MKTNARFPCCVLSHLRIFLFESGVNRSAEKLVRSRGTREMSQVRPYVAQPPLDVCCEKLKVLQMAAHRKLKEN